MIVTGTYPTVTDRYEARMLALGLRVVAWSCQATTIRELRGLRSGMYARGTRARVVPVQGGAYRLALVAAL